MITLLDEGEDLIPAGAFPGRGEDDPGQFFPALQRLLPEDLQVFFQLAGGELVAFGEDDDKRDPPATEEVHESMVVIQTGMTGVDEQEEAHQVVAPRSIVDDQTPELFALLPPHPGIAVARQVGQVPGVIDEEVVDELCLAGSGGDTCQVLSLRQHVDERRFTHVRAARKSILGTVGRRAQFQRRAASGKGDLADDHAAMFCGGKNTKSFDRIVRLLSRLPEDLNEERELSSFIKKG